MLKGLSIISTVVFLCCISFVSSVQALTKGFEVLSFRPAADGGSYFTIYDSDNLKQLQWDVGTIGTYAYRPLQFRGGGGEIVHYSLVQHIYGSVGIVDKWLEAGVEAPIGWWVRWTDPNLAGATAQNKQAIGDVLVHLKTQILNADDHVMGFAILPFISIPTGYGRYFFGNGSVAGGGKLIAEFKPIKRLGLAVNAGVYARERFDIRDTENTHQIIYGLGTSVGIIKGLSVVGEIYGRTRLTGPFAEACESPTEAVGGLKYAVGDTGITVNGGGGAGIVKGAGAPTFRAFLGINYQSPPPTPSSPVAESSTPKSSLDIVKGAVIYFSPDGFDITEDGAVLLGKVADVLREYPEVRVRIVGYTDDMGGKNLNLKVSKKRADKVKWYLGLRGVGAGRMEAVGRDGADPRGDNRTSKGRAANRRVEFETVE